ncbi:MAG: SAM-dependent methyltransferase [Deltaproteobacteria bacterium]|nr:SAM-dependent methyltransferase [Deltaproteobacteria bacterium]
MPDPGRPGGATRASSHASLAEREIIDRIRTKGRITFAEFMETALYWPDGGYYTGPSGVWGGNGDYVTNLDMGPVFSKLIARQVHEMWTCLGSAPGFELIEAGAGRGWLSKGILSAIDVMFPDLGRAIKVRLVERNANLRQAAAGRVSWHADIKDLDKGVKGCVLSNELIDSFPVHRVVRDASGLKEVYIGFDGSGFVDIVAEPSTPALAGYFRDLNVELAAGQRAEVNLKALEWIAGASSLLDAGFVMTIDYGWPARDLYAPERMRGTLRCHFRHTVGDNPYVNIGSQDITAHIDFTALARAGAKAGLDVTGFTTQKNFLIGAGIIEELEDMTGPGPANPEKLRHNQFIKGLIMPGGMGDDFKVLIQHKGAAAPRLSGFSFKEMSPYLHHRA